MNTVSLLLEVLPKNTDSTKWVVAYHPSYTKFDQGGGTDYVSAKLVAKIVKVN